MAIKLNEDRFVNLLEQLINETEHLQNNPPKFIPEESRVVRHLLKLLEPHSVENGGVLKIEHVEFIPNRGNLIIEYNPPSAGDQTVAFVGSHMDVVPANKDNWTFEPFKFSRDGDKLCGRGTTDCLGHVALLTDMFLQLAETKPQLNVNVIAVFIASEENSSIPGVGVDKLLEVGKLNRLKNGPVYWVDSADSQPCIGTAGAIIWTLRANGKLFHSGLPHKGINSLELASEAIAEIQKRFYADFGPHEQEKVYSFATPSTMKPTQVKCAEGSANQLPPWTEITGDIRLTPFYNVDECIEKVKGYVEDINKNIHYLPTRGTVSKYEITEENGDKKRGELVLTFGEEPFKGIACKLDSPGFIALRDATAKHKGEAKPYSICGSLPLVGDLQAAGFDVQVCGYGISSVYHGDDEYCKLSDMKDAMAILSDIVFQLSENNKK